MAKIFISGGSRGIGLAIAKKFYEAGFTVIICGKSAENLAAAQKELPELHTFVCDLSDKQAVKALAQNVNETFGALDVLVNNAGVFQGGLIHTEADEVLESQISTNLFSAYYLSKGLLPKMMAEKKGSIFNISSIAGLAAYPNGSSYSISKFALTGFGKALREEMKPFGIRVINVFPGAVYTDSWVGSGIEAERLMSAEDVAQAVWDCYQLSPRTVVEELILRHQLGDL